MGKVPRLLRSSHEQVTYMMSDCVRNVIMELCEARWGTGNVHCKGPQFSPSTWPELGIGDWMYPCMVNCLMQLLTCFETIGERLLRS